MKNTSDASENPPKPQTAQSPRSVEPVNKARSKELAETPEMVRDAILFQMHERVARGKLPTVTHKKLRDDVMQMSFPYNGDTYRAFYTTKKGDIVLLLIVFQKKTNGQATNEIGLAQQRLKGWKP